MRFKEKKKGSKSSTARNKTTKISSLVGGVINANDLLVMEAQEHGGGGGGGAKVLYMRRGVGQVCRSGTDFNVWTPLDVVPPGKRLILPKNILKAREVESGTEFLKGTEMELSVNIVKGTEGDLGFTTEVGAEEVVETNAHGVKDNNFDGQEDFYVVYADSLDCTDLCASEPPLGEMSSTQGTVGISESRSSSREGSIGISENSRIRSIEGSIGIPESSRIRLLECGSTEMVDGGNNIMRCGNITIIKGTKKSAIGTFPLNKHCDLTKATKLIDIATGSVGTINISSSRLGCSVDRNLGSFGALQHHEYSIASSDRTNETSPVLSGGAVCDQSCELFSLLQKKKVQSGNMFRLEPHFEHSRRQDNGTLLSIVCPKLQDLCGIGNEDCELAPLQQQHCQNTIVTTIKTTTATTTSTTTTITATAEITATTTAATITATTTATITAIK